MNKKVMLLLPLLIGGCAAKAPQVNYSEPEENFSKLSFLQSSSFMPYDENTPENLKVAMQHTFYQSGGVVIFDDNEKCEVSQIVDESGIVEEKLKVNGNQPITLRVGSFQQTPYGNLRCFNKLSFTPKTNHSYTVNQKIVYETGYCAVEVLDDESNEAIDVFDRDGLFGCTNSQLESSEAAKYVASKILQ